MPQQTLQYLIKAQLDESSVKGLSRQLKGSVNDGLIKSLENQLDVVNKAMKRAKQPGDIQKFIELERQVHAQKDKLMQPSAGTAMKSMMGGFMDSFKPGSFLTGMLGQILGSVAIIATLAESLQPMFTLVTKIVKTIGEILRPIGDIVTAMLRPILGLILPILRIVNTMMAPFRQAANVLSSSAMQDLADGFTSGDGGLIAKGITKSLLAGATLFTGFQAAIRAVLFDIIKVVFNGLYSLTTALVYRPMMLIGSYIVSVFSEKKAKQLAGIGGTMIGAGEATLENFFGFMDSLLAKQTDVSITAIKESASLLGVNLEDSLTETMANVSLGDIFSTFWDNQKEIFSTAFGTVRDIMTGAFDDEFADKSIADVFDDMAKTTADTLKDKITKNYTDMMKGLELPKPDTKTTLTGNMSVMPGSQISPFSGQPFMPTKGPSEVKTDWSKLMSTINEASNLPSTVFPDDWMSKPLSMSLNTAENRMMQSFTPNTGNLVKPVNDGLKEMDTKAKTFGVSMFGVTKILSDAITRLADLGQKYNATVQALEKMQRAQRARGV